MVEKSDKELAVELTTALLEHNASIKIGATDGGEGTSKDELLDFNVVGETYKQLLNFVNGSK